MSIATRSDLLTKGASWLRRSGNATFVAELPDCLTIAESRLNREIGPIESDNALTGVVGSRSLDISAISFVEPIGLWRTAVGGGDEEEVAQQNSGTMGLTSSNGQPVAHYINNQSSLVLNCPCDQAYPFRWRTKGRFALVSAGDTNWLLTNHPDIYLAALLMWGAGYLESWANGQVWKQLLDEELPKVAHILTEAGKGTLRVDPALADIGRRTAHGYNVFTD